jgi:hypothetical protein
MSIIRAEVIARMRVAFREGMSASTFIENMRAVGLSYRRTDMLADWRDVNELEKKEGLARYVRKGYVPSERSAEIKAWEMSREYMYKVRSESVLRAGEPVVTRFVNIMSDKPLTIEEIEVEAWERSFTQSPPVEAEERKFTVITAIHKAME